MERYPRKYPVLEKTTWRIADFSGGTFTDTEVDGSALRLAEAKESGSYFSSVIDPGQAVKWSEISWEADLPEGSSIAVRTRTGWTEESCMSSRWTAKYESSPAGIRLIGSPEGTVKIAADRFIQVRVEMKCGMGESPVLKSITLKCEIIPPACVGPKNRAEVTPGNPRFYWTPVEGAAGYDFELSSDMDFRNLLLNRTDLQESEFPSPLKLDEGVYHWRVRSVDGSGNRSVYSPSKQFTVKDFPDIDTSKLQHPYLYFSREDIPAIKERFQNERADSWKAVLEKADKAISLQLPEEKEILLENNQHGGFLGLNQVCHDSLLPLACAGLFTGEEKYIAKARELALHLAGFSRWTGFKFGDASSFYPIWNGTLETSMIGRYVALVYDWLYDYLSEDDKVRIRSALLRLCVLPLHESWAEPSAIRYVPRHQVGAGNWWTVCNSGGGVAAMALLKDVPDAIHWVRDYADSVCDFLTYPGGDTCNVHLQAGHGDQNIQVMEKNWGDDGGYIESLGYAHYALIYSLYLMYPLKQVMGIDLTPFVHPKIADTPFYFGYRNAEDGKWALVDFNDSNSNNWSDDCYVLLSRMTGNKRAKLLLDTTWPMIENVVSLLAEDSSFTPGVPEHTSKNRLFGDIGWCVFRSGWGERESMLAAKFKEGRGHNDIGQFVINYNGRQFVIDSGTISYGLPVYGQFLRTSQAHNVVMVDDQQQIRIDGSVLGFAEISGAGIVEADLTPAYQDLVDNWTRTLIYLEPGCFVVIDRLAAEDYHQYKWLIHPYGKTELVQGSGAKIVHDDCEMHLQFASSREWQAFEKDGYLKGEPVKYLSFEPVSECDNVILAGVFVGCGTGEMPEVGKTVEEDRIIYNIAVKDANYTIVIQPEASGESSAAGVSAGQGIHAVATIKGPDGVKRRWVSAGGGGLEIDGVTVVSAGDSVIYSAGEM